MLLNLALLEEKGVKSDTHTIQTGLTVRDVKWNGTESFKLATHGQLICSYQFGLADSTFSINKAVVPPALETNMQKCCHNYSI